VERKIKVGKNMTLSNCSFIDRNVKAALVTFVYIYDTESRGMHGFQLEIGRKLVNVDKENFWTLENGSKSTSSGFKENDRTNFYPKIFPPKFLGRATDLLHVDEYGGKKYVSICNMF
jgi:hypothetical protein